MKLTSADVAEVIRRRLLQKNEAGIDALTDIYEEQHNNFKTLFDFGDGAQTYRNFRSREEFVDSYPFVPYQFPLFQAAIAACPSTTRSRASTARSASARCSASFSRWPCACTAGRWAPLATFDLMFEGIRSALKAQSQTAILTAESNLDDPLAVRAAQGAFPGQVRARVQGHAAQPHRAAAPRLWRGPAGAAQADRGGAQPARTADLRPAHRRRLRVPDQRGEGRRAGDQEHRGRERRGGGRAGRVLL